VDGATEKQCPLCGEWKPLTFEYWHHSKQTFDGFHGICKTCSHKIGAIYKKTDRAKKLSKINRIKNIETIRKYRKKIQPAINERAKIRSKIDLSFSLNKRMRSLMWRGLRSKKGGRKWQDIAGYSLEALRQHLEKQFKDGMTWERFLAGEIHIDHKIPRAAFNYSRPEHLDFKKCWALKNLQPMWALENISKGARLDKPFQPSLLI
jgi:hypothetical protein